MAKANSDERLTNGTASSSASTGARAEDERAADSKEAKVPLNSIRPLRPRERTPLVLRDAVPAPVGASLTSSLALPSAPEPNGPSTSHATATSTSGSATAVERDKARAIPDSVRQRFVQVENKYYFPDGARAFTDRGQRLTTTSANSELVQSLVEIAQARGWSGIKVTGTEAFRKEAWAAARLAGLNVRGYHASELEQAQLVRQLARSLVKTNAYSAPAEPVKPDVIDVRRDRPTNTARDGTESSLIVGRLLEHGAASFQHDRRQEKSYFVKLKTERGEREIWGVDLARALKHSLSQPKIGDEVSLRTTRQVPVTVSRRERSESGYLTGRREIATHRNHWAIDTRAFLESRAAAADTFLDPAIAAKQGAAKHPELLGSYLQVRAAELVAAKFKDPQDRLEFITRVRTALADSIARGEALPPVQMRDREVQRTDPAPARDRRPSGHEPPTLSR